MLFCADFCVLGFQCIIVMILHNFWISNVLIQKTEVVEHCTACINICTKAELTSRALKKKMEHSWSSSSDGSLNNVLCTSIIGIESKLCRILFRLSVFCDEADEHSHKDTHHLPGCVFLQVDRPPEFFSTLASYTDPGYSTKISSYQKKSCFHCLSSVVEKAISLLKIPMTDLLILCTMLCSSWMSKASDSSLYDAVHSL
ncbi:uncharacterized protein LOC113055670 isoform X2 [Carassius auratus]|uniref:Uncharacterized protein LOC113055670 isoform X2 n=1 Tax=Carassius auratus TaxID=7957 RepID=A0A6P6L2X2_CARAU|nr:uncharacterized protein LOC113055670 isoform X2 [Carassius auratus]